MAWGVIMVVLKSMEGIQEPEPTFYRKKTIYTAQHIQTFYY